MRVAVFGATGGIGREVVDAALAAGHEVVAFTRDSARLADVAGRVDVFVGDAEDAAAVEDAVAGADAVISALGPTKNAADEVTRSERVIRNILAAMESHGTRRLVALSGAGVTARGEKKPLSGRIASGIVRLAVRHVVAAKQREYEILAESAVDWTAVRPPRVTDGAATGTYHAGAALAGRSIARGDLARFMVDQLESREYVREAPYVSG